MTAGFISVPEIIAHHRSGSLTIDTNTLIEIRHPRHDVDLYYTLDGSKPDTSLALSSRKSTFEYRTPFYITGQFASPGKVTIKAIAVKNDGLFESQMTTRTFNVRLVPSNHPMSTMDENRYLHELLNEHQANQRRIEQLNRENELRRQRDQDSMHLWMEHRSDENIYPVNPTETLRCSHCLSIKDNDPYTRYCKRCGRPWEKLTHQPIKKTSTIRTCPNCDTVIPFNSNVCVVCETPSHDLSLRRTQSASQAKLICRQCKTENSLGDSFCSLCQSSLMPTTYPAKRACVSVESTDETKVWCLACGSENYSDAKFCSWCGVKRVPRASTAICTKCQAKNSSDAKFCAACGCVMERAMHLLEQQQSQLMSSNSMLSVHHAARLPQSPVLVGHHSVALHKQPEAATQTYGIYYPSAKDIELVIDQRKKLLEYKDVTEHQPRLSSASPGKGYWKKQIDHLYTNLQDYAKKRPEFQAVIGDPPMGKLVHATVKDNGQEVMIRTVFSKVDDHTTTRTFSNRNDHKYRNRTPNNIQIGSDDEYPRVEHEPRKPRSRSDSPPVENSGAQKFTEKLVKLLEKPRAPRTKSGTTTNIVNEVRTLLQRGANANARNADEYTILQLAVKNGHHDCLEPLIRSGRARLDKRGGPRGDTPLHECCRLGDDGVEPLRILLQYGGDHTWLNDKKESVVDLASKRGSTALIEILALHRDQVQARS